MRIVMAQRFLKAFEFTKQNEGGFSNDARDKGGATIYGVSSKWFPDVYKELMEAKPEEIDGILKAFYYSEFWNPMYEELFFEPTAIRLYDLSVNISKQKAIELLQKTFNGLSNTKIGEDGKFGAMTLKAINLPPIQHENFYARYVSLAEAYYRSLKDFEVFGNGWLSRLHRTI